MSSGFNPTKQLIVGRAAVFVGTLPSVTCSDNDFNSILNNQSLVIQDSNNNGVNSSVNKHGFTTNVATSVSCNGNTASLRTSDFSSIISTTNISPFGTAVAGLSYSPGDGPQCRVGNDNNSVSLQLNYNNPGLTITNNTHANVASINLDASGIIQVTSTSTNAMNVNGNLNVQSLTYVAPLGNINPLDTVAVQLNALLVLLKNANYITRN